MLDGARGQRRAKGRLLRHLLPGGTTGARTGEPAPEPRPGQFFVNCPHRAAAAAPFAALHAATRYAGTAAAPRRTAVDAPLTCINGPRRDSRKLIAYT